LTKVVLILMGVYVVVSLVSMLANLMWHSMLVTAAEGRSLDLGLMAKKWERMFIAGRVEFWMFVVTGIVFLAWVRRANINSRGFGAANMNFSPGWSIGFYFIPILNLFKPFQAMKEILFVSRDAKRWGYAERGEVTKFLVGLVALRCSFIEECFSSFPIANSHEDPGIQDEVDHFFRSGWDCSDSTGLLFDQSDFQESGEVGAGMAV
ncbi:DUF4328 domain-containing protein, partial [Akkermansiaceae bacterium]|nr:DUF4328 domain-containing protein [Akkermansiaceae bacterium]